MNKQKGILFATVMVLLFTTGGLLQHRRSHQKLGEPGIKATSIPDSPLMEIDLPTQVMDFVSKPVPPTLQETNMLPQDTSIVKRHYTSPDVTNGISITVVMMGTDRTSIHKPQYCISGQGWAITKKEARNISIPGTSGYSLPAMRWTLENAYKDEGGKVHPIRGFYLFWFTAENEVTGEHPFWRIMRKVLLTGVLPRWSYVSYFCYFRPEAEPEMAEQLTKFVVASAPSFQLPPKDQ
jgi:hypothetical protein